MPEIFSIVIAVYIMSAGFGLLLGGSQGFQRVNHHWLQLITRIISWTLNLLGDVLKSLGKKVRR